MKMCKSIVFLGLLSASCLAAAAAAAADAHGRAQGQGSGDRTVTQVVKLLQSLVETSKAEGDAERALYAKYKCYCDTNEEQKKAEIQALTEQISILEAKIEELLASSAKLSKEVAQLDKDKTENEQARQTAADIRGRENTAFLALEADLVDAISKMGEAIQVLSDIGADQTLGSATGHVTYMAGHGGGVGLTALKSTVQKALLAASAFSTKKQLKTAEAFLQAPFTGVYSAESGEVLGILKDMRATFTANLDSARQVEAAAAAAHAKYMAAMQEAWNKLDAQYTTKQGELSGNDGDLSAKRTQLGDAKVQLDDAEQFLASLLDMCAAKKKQYNERVALRAQEQAALSEAIAILNSDAAFATFGTVQATSSTASVAPPTLFQIRRHSPSGLAAAGAGRRAATETTASRQKAKAFLQAAAKKVGGQGSPLLSRIMAMLQANNPFKVVLEEIDKMIALLEAEGKADADQKSWCDKERAATNADILTAEGAIQTLTGLISDLKAEIHDPVTGLLVEIDETQESLKENYDNQVSETADRKQANLDYQKNIRNLVEAQALLTKAVEVLKAYYANLKGKIEDAEMLQVRKDDPAPPATWEDTYSGQKNAGGTDAVGMLEFILDNTKQEETTAHTTELGEQHAYEDSMDGLKTSEATLQATLTNLQATLAQKQEELFEKEKDLKKTEEELAALEAYLLKIKPGCDFITDNLSLRDGNRVTEKAALEEAKTHLMGTPVYQDAMAAAHNESLGDCLSICAPNEDHADCKACLAKVSVPAYCAGHPATLGC